MSSPAQTAPPASWRTVWAGLSGGVDSAVAAARALAAGLDVIGVTFRLGVSRSSDEETCAAAESVARALGIAHRVLDVSPAFAEEVVDPFCAAYLAGRTPNPCIVCNARIKFGALLDAALVGGADGLVTGHYAAVAATPAGPRLARGKDPAKDQSYFLYRLGPETLRHVWFPLSGLHKRDVRAEGARLGIPTHDRSESQDVCFLAGQDVSSFVREHGSATCPPGAVVDLAGHEIGRHDGVCAFTVGQRRGIGVAAAEPLFVVAIDAEKARVVVGPREALASTMVGASDPVWYADTPSARCEARTRYRMAPVPAEASIDGDRLIVRFDRPVEGAAPGQSVVCYNEDIVIGGGFITEVG
ncbi:MAG: tRNA 2-thiouridine(34) synthase MnmA [Anaerosomatales bacterium]|nr:tRNA 2-thiouridine(34) synthase MnmA [Anaerosomatales bacterium]